MANLPKTWGKSSRDWGRIVQRLGQIVRDLLSLGQVVQIPRVLIGCLFFEMCVSFFQFFFSRFEISVFRSCIHVYEYIRLYPGDILAACLFCHDTLKELIFLWSCNQCNLSLYYIHFEITGYPCNVIGSQWCDLFPNRTIFCSKSHLFSRPMRMAQKNKTTNQISRLFFKLTNHITGK